MRFSTLMGVFALLCAGYFLYQALQAAPVLPAAATTEAADKAIEKMPEALAEKTAPDKAAPNYGTFTCTPDNFTLISTADGYHLKGVIETPTPGYSYTPRYIDETADAADMVFDLHGPQGMAAQVISKMEIDHMYVRDGSMQTMTVRLDKTFNWGTDTIVCKNTPPSKTDTPAPDAQEQQETPEASETDAPAAE